MDNGPKATFVLSPDDPSTTTIYDTGPDRTALYTISTRRRWNGTTTYVANIHGLVLASLERRFVLTDRVILGTNQPMPLREWLRTSLADRHSIAEASFKDESGRKYKWRGHVLGSASALELFSKDDEYAQPIARFDRSRETSDHEVEGEPATLTLTRRALEIRDMIVISFLFVEKGRRNEETRLGTRGPSQSGDMPAVPMASYGRAVVGPGW